MQKMALDKKKGRYQNRRNDEKVSARGNSAPRQKPYLCSTAGNTELARSSVDPEHKSINQQRRERLKAKMAPLVAYHCPALPIDSVSPLQRQRVVTAAGKLLRTNAGGPPMEVDTQTPKDTARSCRDTATTCARATSCARSGSRQRTVKHRDPKSPAPAQGGSPAGARTSRPAGAIKVNHEGPPIKTSEIASPSSTSSECTPAFDHQGKSAAGAIFGNSPTLQQLSQSSTSATPPASDCSSDESPSPSPDLTKEATRPTGDPFERPAEHSAKPLPAVTTNGGMMFSGTATDESCFDGQRKSIEIYRGRGTNCDGSARGSSSPAGATVSNWPSSPRLEQELTHMSPRDEKAIQDDEQGEQPANAAQKEATESQRECAHKYQTASGRDNSLADKQVPLTTASNSLAHPWIPSQSFCQVTTQHGTPAAVPAPLITAAFSPLSKNARPSVSTVAAAGSVARPAIGLANTCALSTVSAWQCLSPASSPIRDKTVLQRRQTLKLEARSDVSRGNLQMQGCGNDPRQQKRSIDQELSDSIGSKAVQSSSSNGSSTDRRTAGEKFSIQQQDHTPKERTAPNTFSADRPEPSWKQQQSTGNAVVIESTRSLRATGCTAHDVNTSRMPDMFFPLRQPPPPPVSSPYPVSSGVPTAHMLDDMLPPQTSQQQCIHQQPQHQKHLHEQRLFQQQGAAARIREEVAGALNFQGGRDCAREHAARVGDSRRWTASYAGINSPNMWSVNASDMGFNQETRRSLESSVPLSSVPPSSCPRRAGKTKSVEAEHQRSATQQYKPCDPRSGVSVPGATRMLQGSNGGSVAVAAAPFQPPRTRSSVHVASGHNVDPSPPPFASDEAPREEGKGFAMTAGSQCDWGSYPAGASCSSNKPRSSGTLFAEVSSAHLRKGQQPWPKSLNAGVCSMTCSCSRCCPSQRCESPPPARYWPPTIPLPPRDDSFGNSSCVGSAACGTHQSDLSPPYSFASLNKGYVTGSHAVAQQQQQMDLVITRGPFLPNQLLQQQDQQQLKNHMLDGTHAFDVGHSYCGVARDGLPACVPRSISGSNSGILWSTSVPPISLLLTLPLNLPYGKIVKFGSPNVPPYTTLVLRPPPLSSEPVLAGCDAQPPIHSVNDRPTPATRSLGAKKSYYCFSPTLHPAAYTLFSHTGGICDTFAASLHLELAILYVPPPLLATVSSIFQSLATRLPRLVSPLKLECGGLEERNAPGRFGGKVLTVSCAVGEQQERYKFHQMQDFLMLFQSKVELLLHEYALQQQLLLGESSTPGLTGAPIPGKKHNIWRYAMTCLPTSLSSRRLSSPSGFFQANAAVTAGSVAGSPRGSATGAFADKYVTAEESSASIGSNNRGAGGGFLDLTVRAFEAKTLDKATKEYAKNLVVKDVCISEIRLVTTRGIEGRTCEIDPRYPQYNIGTRPIVLSPDRRLCRHSLVDFHALPDVWEVRLRPGNTRDEQKRLVERCVLATIENKPFQVRNEALKAATDAGVSLWVNGTLLLLPPPPPPALEGTPVGRQQEQQQAPHRTEQAENQGSRLALARAEKKHLQRQGDLSTFVETSGTRADKSATKEHGKPSRDTVERARACVGHSSPQEGPLAYLPSSLSKDLSSNQITFSNQSSSAPMSMLVGDGYPLYPVADAKGRSVVGSAVPAHGGEENARFQQTKMPNFSSLWSPAYPEFPALHYPPAAVKKGPDFKSQAEAATTLAPSRTPEKSLEPREPSGMAVDETHAQQDGEHAADRLEIWAAGLTAVPPGLDVSSKATALRAARLGGQHSFQQTGLHTFAEVATLSSLPQAETLLQAVASGLAQQHQQQKGMDAAAEEQQQKTVSPDDIARHEKCVKPENLTCASALQHVPMALQYFQQLQHALSSKSSEDGTRTRATDSLATSLLIQRLLSLPHGNSTARLPAQLHNQGKVQHQQQERRDFSDCTTPFTCRRSNGSAWHTRQNTGTAAPAPASSNFLPSSNGSLEDLVKLLESEVSSSNNKPSTTPTVLQKVPEAVLPQGRRDAHTVTFEDAKGDSANRSTNNCTNNNKSRSANFAETMGSGKRPESREASAFWHANDSSSSSSSALSSPWIWTADGTPTGLSVQGTRNAAAPQSKAVALENTARLAEVPNNWQLCTSEASLLSTTQRGTEDSNLFLKERHQRQQRYPFCRTAAHETTTTTNSLGDQQYGVPAGISENMQLLPVQQHQQRKPVSQHQRLQQRLAGEQQQELRQCRESAAELSAQELLESQALEILRGGTTSSGRDPLSLGLLSKGLWLQHELTSSICTEFAGPACSSQQRGGGDALPQQQTASAKSYLDSFSTALKREESG